MLILTSYDYNLVSLLVSFLPYKIQDLDVFRKIPNISFIEFLRKTRCVTTSYFGARSIKFPPNRVKWLSLKISYSDK